MGARASLTSTTRPLWLSVVEWFGSNGPGNRLGNGMPIANNGMGVNCLQLILCYELLQQTETRDDLWLYSPTCKRLLQVQYEFPSVSR